MNTIANVKSTILAHKGIFARNVLSLKSLQVNHAVLAEIPKIINSVDDLAIVLLPIILAKPLFKFDYYSLTKSTSLLTSKSSKNIAETEFIVQDKSFLGYIRYPLLLLTRFPLFCYLVDVMTIVLNSVGIGLTFVKGSLPDLVVRLAINVLCGAFLTRIKDYIFQQILRRNRDKKVDEIRNNTIDELSSIAIWVMICVINLELLQLKTGLALGSVFALGGAGTASVVLALRTTFENVIGGLLLKLQDKFRVGEIVSIPNATKDILNIKSDDRCIVEEIGYVFCKLRKDDNSLLQVPNHIFSQGEVINWSRTPFRRFQTNLIVSLEDMKQLSHLISNIRLKLTQLNKIETVQRNLIVAATGFKDNKVIIDVEVHMLSNNDIECGEIKTQIIDIINTCIIERFNSGI